MLNVNGSMQPMILANMSTIRTRSFAERVEAAASAGFDSIGMSLSAYRETVATGTTPQEMKSILTSNGVSFSELEVAAGFAVDADQAGSRFYDRYGYTPAADIEAMFAIADTFGCRHLAAMGAFDADLEPNAVERFAELCDRAAEVDLLVALAFVPTTNIPDAGAALRLVEEANRANGGLLIDFWHHFRGAADLELIRAVPADRVILIQVGDGTATPAEDVSFLEEAFHLREAPGRGGFDIDSLLSTMYSSGVSAPVSVEVLSDTLGMMEPADATRLLAETTTEVFERQSCAR